MSILPDQYLALWKRLTWRAYRHGFTRSEAEDLAQETLMAAFIHVPHLEGRDLRAWLNTVLRNKALNIIRSVAHREMRQSLSLSDPDADHLHPVQSPAQDHAVFLRQTLTEIEALPDRAKRLITLIVIEGRSYDEVCRMLAIPIGTLKSALSRAHAELRERLKDRPAPRPA
ncbi:RNA polymerase sigma factor [Dongia sp.]|uniref:RNA polymerase sigma factor n=1 Tax=Dongia sp. TaxID=1977262 RepID=UPI0035B27671